MPERPLASVHRLTIAVTIFTAIIVIGLLTIGKSAFRYKVSKQEMLTQIIAKKYLFNPEEVTAVISQDNGKVKFVDLRNQYEFNHGHIPGALNIPRHKILDEETLELFGDDRFTFVLYGNDELEANGPWMVLSQMGFSNFKILKGGYQSQVDGVLNKANYQYDKILSEATLEVAKMQSAGAEATVPQKKKKVKVVLKKVVKEVAEEEGC